MTQYQINASNSIPIVPPPSLQSSIDHFLHIHYVAGEAEKMNRIIQQYAHTNDNNFTFLQPNQPGHDYFLYKLHQLNLGRSSEDIQHDFITPPPIAHHNSNIASAAAMPLKPINFIELPNTPVPINYVPLALVQSEFLPLLRSLTGSKDSIKSARRWIMLHTHEQQIMTDVLTCMHHYMTQLPAHTDAKLQVIYVLNDVLSASHKNSVDNNRQGGVAHKNLLTYLQPVILSLCSIASKGGDCARMLKLIQSWQDRQFADIALLSSLAYSLRLQVYQEQQASRSAHIPVPTPSSSTPSQSLPLPLPPVPVHVTSQSLPIPPLPLRNIPSSNTTPSTPIVTSPNSNNSTASNVLPTPPPLPSGAVMEQSLPITPFHFTAGQLVTLCSSVRQHPYTPIQLDETKLRHAQQYTATKTISELNQRLDEFYACLREEREDGKRRSRSRSRRRSRSTSRSDRHRSRRSSRSRSRSVSRHRESQRDRQSERDKDRRRSRSSSRDRYRRTERAHSRSPVRRRSSRSRSRERGSGETRKSQWDRRSPPAAYSTAYTSEQQQTKQAPPSDAPHSAPLDSIVPTAPVPSASTPPSVTATKQDTQNIVLKQQVSMSNVESTNSSQLPVACVSYRKPILVENPSNPLAYLDITISGEYAGRIVLELYKHCTPNTVDNFIAFIQGWRSSPSSSLVGYKGSMFHRCIRDFMIQAGELVVQQQGIDKTLPAGFPNISIYGAQFKDEDFTYKNRVYCLSMANAGENTNACQFFIGTNTEGVAYLDGKHVVFGQVLAGRDVVRRIESVDVDLYSKPLLPCVISACGLLSSTESYTPDEQNSDPYPLHPADCYLPRGEQQSHDAENGMQVSDIVRIAGEIRAIGNLHFAAGEWSPALLKYAKALKYLAYEQSPSPDEKLSLDQARIPLHLNRAVCYLKRSEYDAAIQECKAVLELEPNNAKACMRIGQAYLQTYVVEEERIGIVGDAEQALSYLQRAQAQLSQDAGLAKLLAQAKQQNAIENDKQKKLFSKAFSRVSFTDDDKQAASTDTQPAGDSKNVFAST